MEFLPELQVEITPESPDELLWGNSEFDFDKIIFDLDSVLRELNEVLKTAIKSIAIAAGITIAAVATAGAFAPAIAVDLVGSNFAGLSGAALTSACLAYLGGGAIAIGGAGMAGGTIAIVGGGAALGLGVGAGVGGAVGAVSLSGKKGQYFSQQNLSSPSIIFERCVV